MVGRATGVAPGGQSLCRLARRAVWRRYGRPLCNPSFVAIVDDDDKLEVGTDADYADDGAGVRTVNTIDDGGGGEVVYRDQG